MSPVAPLKPSNSIVAAISRKDRKRFLGQGSIKELIFGEILSEVDEQVTHVYFPMTGFISLVAPLDGHPPLEMGLIGNEGMLGATLALGVASAPMRAIVQGPGHALRLSASQFRREMRRSTTLRAAIDRYLFVMLAQLARSSACTRFHSIEPRLARWLLMTHDRAQADNFRLTHEFLADMLGVRRSGVTIAAGKLQKQKLIRYRRGEIRILNRAGLEAASCNCYAALIGFYDRVYA